MTRFLTLFLMVCLALPASAQFPIPLPGGRDRLPIPIPIPDGRAGDGIEILTDIINIVNSRRSRRQPVPERRVPVPLPPSSDGRPGGYDVITAGGRPVRLAPESMPLTIDAAGRSSIVNRAVESWNGAGLGTMFVVVDGGPADLRIDWSGSQVSPGARAETRMSSSAGRIVPTGVSVNTRGRSEEWLVKVLAHEFGHLLGLDHSVDGNDIMYRSEGPGRAELSQRDRSMLSWLYSQPDFVPVVGRTRSDGNVAGGLLRFNY